MKVEDHEAAAIIYEADGRLRFGEDDIVPLKGAADSHIYYRDNERNGRVSRTWKELAEHLGLKLKPLTIAIGVGIDGTQQTVWAQAVPANGMDAPATIVTQATGTGVSERGAFNNVMFKGLDGWFVCWDGPCGVTDADPSNPNAARQLASEKREVGRDDTRIGSLYFVPGTETEVEGFHPSSSRSRSYVVDSPTDGTYMIDTMFARYGYWLADSNPDAPGDQLVLNRYAVTAGNTVDLAWNVNTEDGATTLTDLKAMYEGPAVGMSVFKGIRADESFGPVRSGSFEAYVELTATFGPTPMLGGTIDNFEGKAVNTDWLVTLSDVAVTAGQPADGMGVSGAEGSGPAGVGHPGGVGQNGIWTAQAYGPAAGRPVGIIGTFDAHFMDGHAAGVYATRK